jgi:ribonuclease VapC
MILDTSALAAIFFGEAELELYVQVIHDAERCRISAANFIELSMVVEGRIGPEAGRQCDLFFRRAEIVIEPVAEQAHLARQAFLDFGQGRHPAKLDFGDCFAYALAKATGEPLLFKGDDFSKTDERPAIPAS